MSESKMAIVYGDISTMHHRIIERAEGLFDTVLAVPIDGVKFVHGPDENRVVYKNTDITEFDAVYIRTGDDDKFFAEHLVEVLNEAGVVTQAENDTYAYEANKFYAMVVLAENRVQVPDSVYTLSPDVAVDAAERLSYPVIMKIIGGAGGTGVMRAGSDNELKPVMDTMQAFEQDICLQEFIEHEGTDTRAIVIGDEVYAYGRSGAEGDWRSNISGGGERIGAEVDEELREIALTAARATGFDMCGADIVGEPGNLYVLEINGSFGLHEQVNELVGTDLEQRIVERLHEKMLEQQAHE